MRKLILFNLVSLDGYFEGVNCDLSWHLVDDEFNDFAVSQLNSADILLLGRKTYQLMANYWPTEQALENDPVVAEKMNQMQKVVVSQTLNSAVWHNSVLIQNDIETEILKLKQQRGKDILIFGSANLSTSLSNAKLIDEYRIMINPIIIGNGRALFENNSQKNLTLQDQQTFLSGKILLTYRPKEF